MTEERGDADGEIAIRTAGAGDRRFEDDALAAAVGRAWADPTPWELLTDLAEIPNRMGGNDGERRAADRVVTAFEAAGVRSVTRQSFPMQRWTRGTSSLRVTDPTERSFETVALPYAPTASVAGPLVDAGHGTPEEVDALDVEGAIVVADTATPDDQRFVHRMEKYGHAVEAGASGFVFVNDEAGQLVPTGSLRFDEEAPIPAVGVSAESGAWLREYTDRGGYADLSVEATTDAGESVNVHGVLGPDTDEEVLVCAHLDAHDVGEGALDNGCGVATLVGATRLLAAVEDRLDRRVRVAGVGSEEVGLLGSGALAADYPGERARPLAVVNLDGVGRGRTLAALTHASDDVAAIVDALADGVDHPVRVDPDPHPFSDHWPFLRRGVPALQLHSDPDSGRARGRGVTHTAADTRDKADPRTVRSHAILAALLVLDVVAASPEAVDDETLRGELVEQDYERGMRAAGIWPDDW